MILKSVFCLSISALAAAAVADVLTSRASVATGGGQVSSPSRSAVMDRSGASTVFVSSSPNLVPGDTNGVEDVFVHDRFWGATTRVSVSSSGVQGNNLSGSPAISADGRYVAFTSFANNLVAGDTNNEGDVFVYDRVTHVTTRVSTSSTGQQSNHESRNPSFGGNLLCFDSFASNLVSGDTNQMPDVFTKNLQTGETKLVSLTWQGGLGNGVSHESKISDSGNVIVFTSNSNNMVFGDANQKQDIFVRLTATGETLAVTLTPNLELGNGHSSQPSISADGRWVAFESAASDLVFDDVNGHGDVFVRDMLCWLTSVASVDSAGLAANAPSSHPAISEDGMRIAFFTFATNLVPQMLPMNEHVVMRDLAMMRTLLVSKNTPGAAANYISREPGLSGNGRFVAYESFGSNLVPQDTNNVADIFVTDLQATGSAPSQYQMVRGRLVGGNLASLTSSDDDRLLIRPGVTFTTMQAPIEVYLIGNVGVNLAELEIYLETSAVPGISQTLEIFNYQTCLFEDLGTKALTGLDSVQSGQPAGELSNYTSSGQTWIRVTYRQTGPVVAYPWTVRIDQARFVVSE